MMFYFSSHFTTLKTLFYTILQGLIFRFESGALSYFFWKEIDTHLKFISLVKSLVWLFTEVPLTDGTNKFWDHPLMKSDFKGGGGSLEETAIETFFLIKIYCRKQYLYTWHIMYAYSFILLYYYLLTSFVFIFSCSKIASFLLWAYFL